MASEYLGGGIATPAVHSTEPHTTLAERPKPIEQLQPPASSPGSDDSTGGIPKGAGGLSSTAGIGSPVPNSSQQGIVSSALEYAFGKKEKEAMTVDAAAPTSDSVTTDTKQESGTSGTYLGAIAGAGAAAGAAVASIIPGMASTTGAEPTAHSSATSASAAETTAPTETSTNATAGTDKTLSEKAAETAESAKASAAETVETVKQSAAETAESANATATKATEDVKEAVSGEEEGDAPKKVSDHEAAVRENKESIPTAGGEKLGAGHEGESKIIPEVPPKQEEVSSSAGQPDSTTAANTEKNTGGASKNVAELTDKPKDSGPTDRPKFMNRLKQKLHLDKKDKP